MPALSDIRDKIKSVIQDSSYSDDAIDAFINEGLLRCAARVLLPALESTDQVATSTTAWFVAIPVSWSFDRNLFLCTDADNRNIPVLSSIALMTRKFSDFGLKLTNGDIECCIVSVDKFMYYPVPAVAQTLTCGFYKKPALLSLDTDEPSCIPEAFHYSLLESFACARIYNQIEDGMDNAKTNTIVYTKLFNEAIDALDEYFKTGRSRPLPCRTSDWV